MNGSDPSWPEPLLTVGTQSVTATNDVASPTSFDNPTANAIKPRMPSTMLS